MFKNYEENKKELEKLAKDQQERKGRKTTIYFITIGKEPDKVMNDLFIAFKLGNPKVWNGAWGTHKVHKYSFLLDPGNVKSYLRNINAELRDRKGYDLIMVRELNKSFIVMNAVKFDY